MDRLSTLWLYEQTSPQKIFTIHDLLKEKKRHQQLKNLLSKAVKQKRVKRIWHGLYHIVPLDNPGWEPGVLDIAQYLCSSLEGHLFFRSSLELHGILNVKGKPADLGQEKTVWLRVKKKGTGIEQRKYGGTTYIIYRQQKKQLGLESLEIKDASGKTHSILTIDNEETFLECIDWIEETLRQVKTAIEFIDLFRNARLDAGQVFDYLDKWDNKKMNAKTGLLLELLGFDQSHAKRLDKLAKALSKKPYYFRQPHKRYIGLAKEHFKHIQKWNLMVPNSLFSLYELEQKRPRTPEQEAALVQATLEEAPAAVEISYTTKISDKPEPEQEKDKKEEKQA